MQRKASSVLTDWTDSQVHLKFINYMKFDAEKSENSMTPTKAAQLQFKHPHQVSLGSHHYFKDLAAIFAFIERNDLPIYI